MYNFEAPDTASKMGRVLDLAGTHQLDYAEIGLPWTAVGPGALSGFVGSLHSERAKALVIGNALRTAGRCFHS